MRILTMGDALVDGVARPTRELAVDDDVPAEISLVLGGQAANVAAWCAALGAEAALVGAVGDDAAGDLVRALLREQGVEHLGPHLEGRTGTVISLVGSGTRTMVSDRGVSPRLNPSLLRPGWFVDCANLHVSGYLLFGSDSGAEAAVAAAARVKEAGGQVSLDLSAATLIQSLGGVEVQRLVASLGPAVVFANQAEFAASGRLEVPSVVVKCGAGGCRVISGADEQDYPAPPIVSVVDTTGAGDAFAAGWLVGGVDQALSAAAACITRVGAMPPPPGSRP